jgi:hypothetical protein
MDRKLILSISNLYPATHVVYAGYHRIALWTIHKDRVMNVRNVSGSTNTPTRVESDDKLTAIYTPQ